MIEVYSREIKLKNIKEERYQEEETKTLVSPRRKPMESLSIEK